MDDGTLAAVVVVREVRVGVWGAWGVEVWEEMYIRNKSRTIICSRGLFRGGFWKGVRGESDASNAQPCPWQQVAGKRGDGGFGVWCRTFSSRMPLSP